MNKYYEVVGNYAGLTVSLFGSFDREDCVFELDAERYSWRAEGFSALKIRVSTTTEQPDPEVYEDLYSTDPAAFKAARKKAILDGTYQPAEG